MNWCSADLSKHPIEAFMHLFGVVNGSVPRLPLANVVHQSSKHSSLNFHSTGRINDPNHLWHQPLDLFSDRSGMFSS